MPPMPHAPSRVRGFPWPTDQGSTDVRSPLTRDQIVDAAIHLLDGEGLDAVSMRRLGSELGAGATSLYWHVRNKDELLDLMVDRIIGEVVEEIAPADTWRAELEEAARALRRVLLRHRHIAPVLGTRPTFGPRAVEAVEWLIGRARAGGAEPRTALLVAQTVLNWATGFTVFECRDPLGVEATEADRRAFVNELRRFVAALPAERFPNTLATLDVAASITPDEQFEFGLQRLMNGIEAGIRTARTSE
jgi:AcrR family transcriptional regulator